MKWEKPGATDNFHSNIPPKTDGAYIDAIPPTMNKLEGTKIHLNGAVAQQIYSKFR